MTADKAVVKAFLIFPNRLICNLHVSPCSLNRGLRWGARVQLDNDLLVIWVIEWFERLGSLPGRLLPGNQVEGCCIISSCCYPSIAGGIIHLITQPLSIFLSWASIVGRFLQGLYYWGVPLLKVGL